MEDFEKWWLETVNEETIYETREQIAYKAYHAGYLSGISLEARHQFDDKIVKLDRDLINQCKTAAGGFTAATLNALGVEWPPLKGWPRRLIGTEVTQAKFHEALEGRFLIGQKISKRSFGAQKGGV